MENHEDPSRTRVDQTSLKLLVRKTCLGIGKKPTLFLLGSLSFCVLITVVVSASGKFEISFSTNGWKSRGTIIGDRAMQSLTLLTFREDLFEDKFISEAFPSNAKDTHSSPWNYLKEKAVHGISEITFLPEDGDEMTPIDCSSSWYLQPDRLTLNYSNKLRGIWNIHRDSNQEPSALLHPDALLTMCEAEELTTKLMGENGFCDSCDEGICPEPYSLVTVISSTMEVAQNRTLSTCEELVQAYSENPQTQIMLLETLYECSISLSSMATGDSTTSTSCMLFSPHLVDKAFGLQKVLRYSASIFYSSKDIDEEQARLIYNLYDSLGKGDSTKVTIVYDTFDEDFNSIHVEETLQKDTALAFVSTLVTTFAMFIHTKSLWLTMWGFLQILFAAPLSYFVYHFIARLSYFPVINLIGLFVSAALGADDLFVAVDKWKNTRIANPSFNTEAIAEIALVEAAGAMLLTTSTTGVAFFATCITVVPPIFTFALFCGLMVIFNYILNCCLVFPALCLYDKWLIGGSTSCLISAFSKKSLKEQESGDQEVNTEREEGGTKLSFIHSILATYYEKLHRFRHFAVLVCLTSIATSAYFAATLKLPDNSEPRLLPPKNQFERYFNWNRLLLSMELMTASSNVKVYWGLNPADTGNHRNPNEMTTLELDETFEPKSTASQEYLRNFCDRLWENDFVFKSSTPYYCPFNSFEDWLNHQSTLPDAVKDTGYVGNCNNSSSLPMDEDYFHSCFSTWGKLKGSNSGILSKDGIVKIIWLEVLTDAQFQDNYNILDGAFQNYETWFREESRNAPVGVNNFFHHSGLWWWKDTNGQMLRTALSAAAIALGFSAVIVLLSSKSLRLTLFSLLSITYVLVAAAASLESIGWELGFIESVCFAILIGISCDFIIHFGHAYLLHAPEGSRTKEKRTKNAIIKMGPSILAAALTTFAAALIMLFCSIQFFTKFAEMLSFTILHAILGSFVVFLSLTDTFGPEEFRFVRS